MNEVLEKISRREFGENDFKFGFKKGCLKQMAATTKKKDLKHNMLKLKDILKNE